MGERPLEGRCALVTGSVAGLGRAVAESLGRAGARVILHGLAEPNVGREAANALYAAHGVEAEFSGAELSDLSQIEALADWANARFGGVDILVNNAVIRHFAPIDAFSAKDWDTSVAVNLTAAFHLMRLSIPWMRTRKWGRIVNVSSIYGSRGAENRIDYVTTKTALIGMTRAAAIELARTGITCNAICPGTVSSPAIVERIETMARTQGISVEAAERDYLETRNPTGRFVSMDAVGELVAFLCGPHGADMTGTVVPIDGGWTAR